MTEVAARLEDGRWETLNELCREKGVSNDDLGKACQAVCLFVLSNDRPKETMPAALERCGWFELAPMARIAVMATLGTITLGGHWAGVREASYVSQGPVLTYQGLADVGKQCHIAMTKPAWKRALRRWWNRFRDMFR